MPNTINSGTKNNTHHMYYTRCVWYIMIEYSIEYYLRTLETKSTLLNFWSSLPNELVSWATFFSLRVIFQGIHPNCLEYFCSLSSCITITPVPISPNSTILRYIDILHPWHRRTYTPIYLCLQSNTTRCVPSATDIPFPWSVGTSNNTQPKHI